MRQYVPDVVAMVGAALVAYGTWLIYPPAGVILAGVALIFIGARAATV
jgi:hypothetical protein